MLRRLALASVIAAALAVTTSVTAATPSPIDRGVTVSERAVRSPAPPVTTVPPVSGAALLISDSAWLGMQTYAGVDQVQGFPQLLALSSCRRRVARSCTNYDGTVPVTLYQEVEAKGAAYSTLIVATGYNDSDANFAGDVEAVVTVARANGYQRVVWLTLRENVTYTSPGNAGFAEVFERSNATLRQIVEDGTYPELVIADWADYSRDRPDWFAAEDGIHLRRLGGYAAGDYISRKMAFLEARACPQPAFAGVEPIDPCPDPDDHGPVIDLDSLYPVDRRDPSMDFTLYYEGSSSWPEPAWWESED